MQIIRQNLKLSCFFSFSSLYKNVFVPTELEGQQLSWKTNKGKHESDLRCHEKEQNFMHSVFHIEKIYI